MFFADPHSLPRVTAHSTFGNIPGGQPRGRVFASGGIDAVNAGSHTDLT
jgi:hypothetical protein